MKTMESVEKIVVAIDVGLRNMSWCVCAGPEGLEPEELAAKLRLISWTTEALPLPAGPWRVAEALRAVVEHAADKEQFLERADVIVIEQQPVARMREVAACLFGLARRAARPETSVLLQSARCKLELFAPNAPEMCRDRSSYGARKRAAVALTRHLLKGRDDWLSLFERAKKKDDLGDSFLHALTYLAIAPRKKKVGVNVRKLRVAR
jgi:hypothetical protein